MQKKWPTSKSKAMISFNRCANAGPDWQLLLPPVHLDACGVNCCLPRAILPCGLCLRKVKSELHSALEQVQCQLRQERERIQCLEVFFNEFHVHCMTFLLKVLLLMHLDQRHNWTTRGRNCRHKPLQSHQQ